MADTIAVLSLKGGTGKTTAVRTLADVLRRVGLEVLAVDLDPQGNLSDYFDVPPDATPTIADVLAGDAKLKEAAHDGIVPATPILAEVERSLSGRMGRELVLKKALKDARRQYDVILIDCPPALGLLTINGLVAADWALVSSEAQYFALQGVNGALEVIGQAKEYYNSDLEFLGVVMNIADMRTTHSRDAYAQLGEAFGEKVFATVDPSIDRLRGVSRAGALDPGLPPRPRRRLPEARRRGARARRSRRRPRRARADARGLTAPYLGERRRSDTPAAAPRGTGAGRGSGPAQRADLGSGGRERHPQHVGPAFGLRAQPRRDRAGALDVAPHEHGRSGAGDRRAERPEPARPLHELPRARVQVPAPRLVDAVLQTASDQVEVAASEPEHQQRGVRDVVDGLGDRDPGRQRVARLGGANRTGRARRAGLEPGGRVEALRLPVRAQHEAAEQRRGDVVGMALDARRLGEHVGAELEDRVGGHAGPATIAAALVPRPPESGISERIVNSKASTGCSAANPRTQQVAPVGSDPQVGVDGEATGL